MRGGTSRHCKAPARGSLRLPLIPASHAPSGCRVGQPCAAQPGSDPDDLPRTSLEDASKKITRILSIMVVFMIMSSQFTSLRLPLVVVGFAVSHRILLIDDANRVRCAAIGRYRGSCAACDTRSSPTALLAIATHI